MLVAERHENERLRQIIKEMQRHRFGRRAETLPEDQLLLALEEADQAVAAAEAESEEATPVERAVRAAKRRVNRGSLPAHLPRIEMVVDIDDHACPCCRNVLHQIGEDVSERLDIVPAQFRVLVTGMKMAVPISRRGSWTAAYGATIRDRGTGSTKVRAGRCTR